MNFNKRILVQNCITSTDEVGGFSESWEDYVMLWADVIPVSHTLQNFKMKNDVLVSYLIKIRYRDDISISQRIIYNGRTMKIQSCINQNEESKIIEISAIEIV